MEIIKNIRKNTVLIIGITIVVLYIVLKDDITDVIYEFKNIDFKYILLAILFYFLYIVFHSYIVYKTVNKKRRFTFIEAIKNNVIVQFFNGITPFSTGGQPMEIYLLTTYDIPVSRATNYVLQNFVFYQLALVLFGVVAIITNTIFGLFPKVNFLRELVIIGFIINTFVAVLFMMITLSEKASNKIINGIINILSKLHIVKDKDKQLEIWMRRIDEFNLCGKELKNNKGLFILGVLFNFLGLACLYVIPLFIAYSLHDFESLNAVSAITSSAYVMVMGAFVPIPGGSGGIEYGFTQFFGNFLSKSKTATSLLLWRFITYYIGMIIGALLFSLDKKKDGD